MEDRFKEFKDYIENTPTPRRKAQFLHLPPHTITEQFLDLWLMIFCYFIIGLVTPYLISQESHLYFVYPTIWLVFLFILILKPSKVSKYEKLITDGVLVNAKILGIKRYKQSFRSHGFLIKTDISHIRYKFPYNGTTYEVELKIPAIYPDLKEAQLIIQPDKPQNFKEFSYMASNYVAKFESKKGEKYEQTIKHYLKTIVLAILTGLCLASLFTTTYLNLYYDLGNYYTFVIAHFILSALVMMLFFSQINLKEAYQSFKYLSPETESKAKKILKRVPLFIWGPIVLTTTLFTSIEVKKNRDQHYSYINEACSSFTGEKRDYCKKQVDSCFPAKDYKRVSRCLHLRPKTSKTKHLNFKIKN